MKPSFKQTTSLVSPSEGMKGGCDLEIHPQRNKIMFGTICFDSDFESGNMLKVERCYDVLGNQFNLWIAPDAAGTAKEMKYKTWFYFKVSGVPSNSLITITIKDSGALKLYKEGHQPVFRSTFQSSRSWQRVNSNVVNTIVQNETGIDISFSHVFKDLEEHIEFAFTYPFTLTDIQNQLERLQASYNHCDIYFNRTTLVQSRESRNVELLTISSHHNRMGQQIKLPSDILFPFMNPPEMFTEKKYVFISTRVHPGEVPGSHVFNGILELLLDPKDERSQSLRERFVFVMVPCINPDGVSRGHYRTDSQGQNLNRFYNSPSPSEQPEVFGIRELLLFLNQTKQLYCYLDLHAHASRRGSFMYGNCMEFRTQIECNLLTKLMALNSPYLEYELCNFTERNMYASDKSDGLSKEGSGRVALYKYTKIPLCYTLECNYNMPNAPNFVYPPSNNNVAQINQQIQEEIKQLDGSIIVNQYPERPLAKEFYIPENYEDLGRGILEALLDINRVHPVSRISNSPYKTLTNLKLQVAYQTIKQLPYRFENYLRQLMRYLNMKDNSSQSMKIFLTYLEKGTKVILLSEPENIVPKRQLAQGGQLLLQNQQLKKKSEVKLGQLSLQEFKMDIQQQSKKDKEKSEISCSDEAPTSKPSYRKDMSGALQMNKIIAQAKLETAKADAEIESQNGGKKTKSKIKIDVEGGKKDLFESLKNLDENKRVKKESINSMHSKGTSRADEDYENNKQDENEMELFRGSKLKVVKEERKGRSKGRRESVKKSKEEKAERKESQKRDSNAKDGVPLEKRRKSKKKKDSRKREDSDK